ncbi:MAG: oligosaccharide flippase family protein [Burkholderiales bacterium]
MQRQIALSILWMLGGNGLQQVLQFVIFILLARYLEPDVFGYVALATVVFDIVGTIGRWGIPETILQRRHASPLFLSHAFIFAVLLGGVLTLLVLAGTGTYIALHGWNLVAQLLLLLAPITLMQAAETVLEAMLRRNLEFKWLALRNNLASLVGGLFAIALAILHLGVYALVAQRFVSLAILLGMVWLLAGKQIRFFPFRRYRRGLFLGIARVGSHLVSGPFAGMLGPRLTDMMVGIVFGPAPLGQLKIARRIFDFVTQVTIMPLSSVAEAAFPRLVGKPAELRAVYKKIQGVCALGVFPLFAGLALGAPMWVPLVLGAKWLEAVPLIQWTSLAAVPAVVNYFQAPLLIAYRQNWLISKQNMARVVSGVALTAIGSLIGLEAVVVLFVAQGYAFMVFNWMMIKKVAGWTLRENLVNIAPASFATAGLAAAMFACTNGLRLQTNWSNLALIASVGVAAYLAVLLLVSRDASLALIRDAVRLFSRRTV